MEAACFDHSCKPNAQVRGVGKKKLQVYALDTIDSEKSQVFISYSFGLENTYKERNAYHRLNYNFDCNCIRCDIANRSKDDELVEQFKKIDREYSLLIASEKNDAAAMKFELALQASMIHEILLGEFNLNGMVLMKAAIHHLLHPSIVNRQELLDQDEAFDMLRKLKKANDIFGRYSRIELNRLLGPLSRAYTNDD